jgi:hypothetical protein
VPFGYTLLLTAIKPGTLQPLEFSMFMIPRPVGTRFAIRLVCLVRSDCMCGATRRSL